MSFAIVSPLEKADVCSLRRWDSRKLEHCFALEEKPLGLEKHQIHDLKLKAGVICYEWLRASVKRQQVSDGFGYRLPGN